jgi:hypothetical protein
VVTPLSYGLFASYAWYCIYFLFFPHYRGRSPLYLVPALPSISYPVYPPAKCNLYRSDFDCGDGIPLNRTVNAVEVGLLGRVTGWATVSVGCTVWQVGGSCLTGSWSITVVTVSGIETTGSGIPVIVERTSSVVDSLGCGVAGWSCGCLVYMVGTCLYNTAATMRKNSSVTNALVAISAQFSPVRM